MLSRSSKNVPIVVQDEVNKMKKKRGKVNLLDAVKEQNVGEFVQNRENRQFARSTARNYAGEGEKAGEKKTPSMFPDIQEKRNPKMIKPAHDFFGDYVDVNHCILAMDDYWSDNSEDLDLIKSGVMNG